MIKKILIIFVGLVATILITPLLLSNLMNSNIESKVKEFNSKGDMNITLVNKDIGYLTSVRHYKVILNHKFFEHRKYLQNINNAKFDIVLSFKNLPVTKANFDFKLLNINFLNLKQDDNLVLNNLLKDKISGRIVTKKFKKLDIYLNNINIKEHNNEIFAKFDKIIYDIKQDVLNVGINRLNIHLNGLKLNLNNSLLKFDKSGYDIKYNTLSLNMMNDKILINNFHSKFDSIIHKNLISSNGFYEIKEANFSLKNNAISININNLYNKYKLKDLNITALNNNQQNIDFKQLGNFKLYDQFKLEKLFINNEDLGHFSFNLNLIYHYISKDIINNFYVDSDLFMSDKILNIIHNMGIIDDEIFNSIKSNKKAHIILKNGILKINKVEIDNL